MAKLKNGIFGPGSGSIGNVVLSSRNGKPYIKSKPDKVKNPQTPKQQAARMKLSLLSEMLGTFKPFIRAGFANVPAGLSTRDVAYSANSKRIFNGEYPNIEIDFSSFLVSSGSLEPANEASAALNGQVLAFTWDPNSNTGKPFSNHDIAMVLVYDAKDDFVVYSLRATERRTGQFNFEIPPGMASSSETLHTWICFVSADGRQSSESTYLAVGGE
ncbi:MAG: DUF6266 family protein [Balneolales bacterium]